MIFQLSTIITYTVRRNQNRRMAIYFGDTSFWVALVDILAWYVYHSEAMEWSRKISGDIVTTEAVLLEHGEHIRSGKSRKSY